MINRLLFFVFIILSNAHATSECLNIDINIKNMPENNDQSNLSWCFAWTATDLLSFSEEKKLSSYDLATQYHEQYSTAETTKHGGKPSAALMFAILNSDGICYEKDTNYTNGDWSKLSELIKDLGDSDKNLADIICKNNYQANPAFKNLSIEVFHILEKLPNDKKLATLFNTTCTARHSLANKYEVNTFYSNLDGLDKVINHLDHTLDLNQPASIGYDIDALLKLPEEKSHPYKHASTIIGRRLNKATNSCEYLIKNSWGDACPKKSKVDCHKGNFWVTKDNLKKSISEVTTLKKK